MGHEQDGASHWAPCRAAAKTHLCQPFWVLRFQSPRRETYGLSTKSGRQAASCLTVPPNCTQLERNSSPNVNRGAITKTAKWSRGKKCLPGAPVRMPHSLTCVCRVSYWSHLHPRLSMLWLNQRCLRSFSVPPLVATAAGLSGKCCPGGPQPSISQLIQKYSEECI